MKTTSLFIPLITAAYVSAHGILRTLTINGQAYTGNMPLAVDNPSVIRQVVTPFPIKGAMNTSLTCGASSTPGTLVANANPGDTLTFSWKGADLSNWPHNTGPMLTYLANCGSTTCDKFDSTGAKWFKIQQVGKNPNNSSLWVQADLMNGGVATATLPNTLAPGNYLVRHEIIALHLAITIGGAEFYPSCSQITVGGTQTGAPKADELVSLPGAYNDNDPGIFDPDVFNPGAPYTFPGPAIASFVTADGSGSGTSGNPATPTVSVSVSIPPLPTQTSASSKSCKVKRRSTSLSAVVVNSNNQPRHFSRIMRRFIFGESHHH